MFDRQLAAQMDTEARDRIARLESLGVKLSLYQRVKIWAWVASKQTSH